MSDNNIEHVVESWHPTAAQVFDPVGWTAEFLEWGALWLCAADEKVCRHYPLLPGWGCQQQTVAS